VIEKLIEQGWADHDKDSAGVLARLAEAIPEVKAADIPAFAGLLVHVSGEHLGRWDDGLALLGRLEAPAGTPEAQVLLRSRATLLLAKGDRRAGEELIERAHSGALPMASTRIRVLAVAAAALAGQRQIDEGIRLFQEALALATYGPGKEDPAARALAVTGNNLAASLEEKKDRDARGDALLELASRTARRFWEIAGTWLEVERAEYRLAMSFIALGRSREALAHATECLALCEKNGADAGERFFAHEALARAHRARMKELLGEVDPSLRSWCEETLQKL
jgi:tetratricopeptide (TPR) repeat protein